MRAVSEAEGMSPEQLREAVYAHVAEARHEDVVAFVDTLDRALAVRVKSFSGLTQACMHGVRDVLVRALKAGECR